MTTTGSTPSGEVDDEEMETSTTTTGAVEAATYNSEEEIGVDESEPTPQSQYQAATQQQHLPRAHSHMPYYPPGVDPVAAAAAFQIAYLQQQIQQQQAANYMNQMSTDYNNNSTEEMQRRQQKFSTNRGGSLSYFSDPYLLRSLQVASISSNANLHPSQQAVANYFRENHHLQAAAAAAAAAAASSASHAANTGNDTSGYINIYF